MPYYLPCLYIHIGSVVVSISLFILRGYWMIRDNNLLNHKLIRILPHIVDTILLVSAIALTIILSQYPFLADWLTVKFFALIAYIIFGTIALKRGKTRKIRIVALSGALLTFAFVASVAYYHHPLGIFAEL